MRRALSALTAGVLLGLPVLTGCADASAPSSSGLAPGVAVDTPALQRLRADAGLEPCVPGPGAGDEAGGDGLPELTLPCLGGGRSVDLSTLRGPLAVTVWAQWCGPCRSELPLYQRLADTGVVDVVGVDWQDPQPGSALQLLRDRGVTFPSLADPDALLKESYPDLAGLPMLVLVAADGTVASRQFVAIRSWAQLRQIVEEDLGVDL